MIQKHITEINKAVVALTNNNCNNEKGNIVN